MKTMLYCKWKDKFKETLGNCNDGSSDRSADNVVCYNRDILTCDHFFASIKEITESQKKLNKKTNKMKVRFQ